MTAPELVDVLGLGEPDAEARAFPREILEGVRSAVILFASGRGGRADGRWLAEAAIADVLLVDWDWKTLGPMLGKAPNSWRGSSVDLFQIGDHELPQADHVSADPPSQRAPEILEALPRWLAIARRSATITLYRHCFAGEPSLEAPELVPPAGWLFTKLIKRGDFRGGIYWLVAERV